MKGLIYSTYQNEAYLKGCFVMYFIKVWKGYLLEILFKVQSEELLFHVKLQVYHISLIVDD